MSQASAFDLARLFVALGETPLGLFMRDSSWAFATTESVHLVALAVVGGAVTLLSLAALGVALGRDKALRASAARGLLPVFVGGLSTAVVTGVLLVASKPYRYYLSDPFRAKMLFLLLGVVLYAALHVGLTRVRPLPDVALKGGAVLVLSLWLGVGLAGRLIGLF